MIHRREFLVMSLKLTAGAALLGSCDRRNEPESGARQGQVTRPTLRLAGEDVGFPSPFAYRRGPGYIKASYIYDTLMWKDASGEVLPWLAAGYEQSNDGRSYTFELRNGVSWHDGEPVTAEDVAFTFDYFRAQTMSPEVIVQPFAEIEEVVAAGERTVEFRLSAPLADFFGYRGVGSVPIVPKHVWADIDNAAAEQDAAVLVGSGPYRLESYSPGEGAYVYSANDDFFLGTPFVERLEFAPIAEPIAGLQAGDIDAASVAAVRPEVLAPFRDNPDLEVLDQPGGNIGSGLFWNLAKGGALADVRFRQACAHAIDREDMVERMLGGNGMPGNPGWIPSTNPFYVEVEQYAFDREAAETLLDDAGYERTGNEEVRRDPDGEPLSFSLLVAEPVTPMVDLVVRALGEIGVELSPRALDVPTFNQRVIAGESEMSIISFGGMNTDHAAGYLHQVYFSETQTTQHAQGYKNPEVDRLVVAQQHELDESARMELVARAQRLIADDLPILPLVYPDGFTVFDKRNFDAWYYTEGGVASTVPLIENKHAFVTGEMTGLEIRSTD